MYNDNYTITIVHIYIYDYIQTGILHIYPSLIQSFMIIIELDDGKIYRKPLYLMVKNHGFPVKIFP